ncbi:MAG: initiation factor 2B [Desulfurococcaceae archaeon]
MSAWVRRLTGSELVFSVLEELAKIAEEGSKDLFSKRLVEVADYVISERPCSMAIVNMVRSIFLYLLDKGFDGVSSYINSLKDKYNDTLWKASEIASKRVVTGDKILTNSNSLAVRRFLKILHDQGKEIDLYITESRPGNEGILVAEYADELGLKAHLIVDSAARFFMKNVDKVFVGAEAIATNGAVVSKVGTSLIALVAKEARKRFFVIAPSYKFSYETVYGELFKVPEGGLELIIDQERDKNLAPSFTARVPIYDVTPPEYIDAVATEYGMIAPQALPLLVRSLWGTYPPTVTPLTDILVIYKSSCR